MKIFLCKKFSIHTIYLKFFIQNFSSSEIISTLAIDKETIKHRHNESQQKLSICPDSSGQRAD